MPASARSRRYSASASAWHFSARKQTLRTSSPSASARPRRAAAQSTRLREYAIAISTSPAFALTLPIPLFGWAITHLKIQFTHHGRTLSGSQFGFVDLRNLYLKLTLAYDSDHVSSCS